MEACRRSVYFSKRSGRKQSRFPKLSAVTDVASHLCLALTVERGPKPDDPAMHRTVAAARRRFGFDILLGDAGYDGENHHVYLYEDHDVIGLIPPDRGRPPKDPEQPPGGFFRRFCRDIWQSIKERYGQRWQIETFFSMLKRKLGSALTARKRHPIDRECHLRAITLNLMILAA